MLLVFTAKQGVLPSSTTRKLVMVVLTRSH